MAAGERSCGSDLSFSQRRSPLVLLLPLLPLLLPARPALGNEGAAAANCQCVKYRTEPALVKRFPDRLVAWERCGRGLIRFIFPKNLVCGWDDEPWVLRLISWERDKRKAAAKVSSSERRSQPSPTSRAPLQPLSSVRSTLGETPPSQQVPALVPTTAPPPLESTRNTGATAKVSSSERRSQPSPTSRAPLQPLSSVGSTLGETPPSQQVPALAPTTALPARESVRSVVLPRNAGAAAEVSPTRLAQEEAVPGWPQTAVLSALGIVLLLVLAGLLCWWRPPRRGRRAALAPEQQVWMLQRPEGGATCSPRAEAAAALSWGAD